MSEKKMKACVLEGINNLQVKSVDIPILQSGQVLIKIHAAGICGSDIERVFSKGTYHYPTIIGHEFSGEIIDEFNAGSDWLGKRVSVFPLIPCMKCSSCIEGKYAQCKDYDYYGSRRDGGFAEYLAVNTWNLFPLSDAVSYESGAMFEPAAVAMHALRQAGSLVGKTLVIFGVGTISLIMAQIAQASGCESIILIARSEEKLVFAHKIGFEDVINSSLDNPVDRIKELTNGRGADIIVEGCGNSETLSAALLSAAPLATVICMGNPSADIAMDRESYWCILRKQLSLHGIWNSTFKVSNDDWKAILQFVEKKLINLEQLITNKYHLMQAQTAFEEIYYKKGKVPHIKSMFIMGE